MIKNLLTASVIVVAFTGPASAQLFGFGGPCVTAAGEPCSGIFEQLAQFARQLLQLEQEITTAEQEVLNTVQLPGALFHDVAAPIQQAVNIAKQADLLVGNTGEFIGNLSASTYPLPDDPMAQRVKHQNAVANAIKQLGSVLNIESPVIADSAQILAALSDETMTADGRLKALQDAGQLHATTGQQLLGLKTITIGMAQGQHATMLAEHDRRAMEVKALDVMSQYTPDNPGGAGF